MCGCEHHWDRNAPCTCTCPDHKAVREEMSRNAPMSATDHTLTDAERAMFERIEDTGDTQGLTWRVQELVTEARALADEESASRVALANQLATAEAEKEALRASKSALVEKVKRLQDQIARANMEPGQDRQKAMHAYAARTEAAEAALADLRAIIPADATTALDAVKAQAAREALLAAADDYERERIERHEIVITALDSKYDNGVVSGPAKFLRARADQIGGAK